MRHPQHDRPEFFQNCGRVSELRCGAADAYEGQRTVPRRKTGLIPDCSEIRTGADELILSRAAARRAAGPSARIGLVEMSGAPCGDSNVVPGDLRPVAISATTGKFVVRGRVRLLRSPPALRLFLWKIRAS